MLKQTVQQNKFICIGIILLVLISCDDFNTEPQSLQPADERAIFLFEDSLTVVVPLSTFSRPDSVLNSMTLSDLADSLIDYNKLIDTTEVVYELSTTAPPDTTYLLLNCDSDKNLVFFFKNYVLMEIVDQESNIYPVLDESIPYATIQSYYSSSGGGINILIKARYEYKLLPNEDFIVKIITTDQTTSNKFEMVIVENE